MLPVELIHGGDEVVYVAVFTVVGSTIVIAVGRGFGFLVQSPPSRPALVGAMIESTERVVRACSSARSPSWEDMAVIATAALTVIGGVLVYAGGQLAMKLLVEPLQKLRSLIGQVGQALVEYADVLSNTPRAVTEPSTLASDGRGRRSSGGCRLSYE